MGLNILDISIVFAYVALTLFIGFWLSKNASKDLNSYFLGGNTIKWYMLGLSNASGMFDISGTMWTVTIFFVYGMKSAWIPWLWPVWNQIFVMVFLAIWMRRSNVMTGAQWMTFRFGDNKGGRLAHLIVIIFAIVSVIGFMTYFFEGIGKFATTFFSADLSFHIGYLAVTSEQSYAMIIIGITTLYTLKGGMYSVVATEVLQFVIMTFACIAIGIIAYQSVTAEQIQAAVPSGWGNLMPSWNLDLDWSGYLDGVNEKIDKDGYGLFGLLLGMMIFKGLFASLAGPVPSYDMQRTLSAKTPAEAAKMNMITNIVLFIPRFLMVAGFGVLAIVYLKPQLQGAGVDFEKVLPMAIQQFVPVGIKGLLLAGLLAAFMGTFAAFVNAAPAYIVNDIYKKYINPNASNKKLVSLSYLSSITLVVIGVILGFKAQSLNTLTLWITSALYGGYAAANVLKWIWWRFNGYGYFWGMLAGLLIATAVWILRSTEVISPTLPDIYLFPLILVVSMAASIFGSLLTKPQDDETLKKFYKQTKPWGWWKPIINKIKIEDPSFEENKDFWRDAVNVVVGIVWQMSMVVLPMYFMIRDNRSAAISCMVLAVTSVILKKNWYDKLEK
ncbi:MAG: sodium:solute symporter family protein [Bacteroidales bacterium]